MVGEKLARESEASAHQKRHPRGTGEVRLSARALTKRGVFADVDFDVVVTVCDNARESCPVFPGGARVVHRAFDDPPRLARDAATTEEALAHYRRVRDEIRDFVASLPEGLK